MRHDGGKLIALGAGLGLLVSTWNFVMPTGLLAPLSSIAGTPGAALMIFSTLCLLLAGIVLAGHRRGGFLIFFCWSDPWSRSSAPVSRAGCWTARS